MAADAQIEIMRDTLTDTMFNSARLNDFLAKLGATAPRGQAETELIATLRAAAESAIRQRGYLWFSGD